MAITLVVLHRTGKDSLELCFEPVENTKALKKRIKELQADPKNLPIEELLKQQIKQQLAKPGKKAAAKKKTKPKLSPEARKRISDAQRKRWAKAKKAKK